MFSYQVGGTADGLRVQHDDFSGDVPFHGFRHVLHCAVDGRIFDLKPVVCIPADEEPYVLLTIEFLFEDLPKMTPCLEGLCLSNNLIQYFNLS